MLKSELIKKLVRIDNIYSFIVELFKFITKKDYKYIRSTYGNLVSKSTNSKYFDIIESLIENLKIITKFEFIEWIDVWIDEFKNSKIDEYIFCFSTLLKIDDNFDYFNRNYKSIIKKGPLNKDDKEYLLYSNQKEFYFKQKLIKGKIRPQRQTVGYDINSINSSFKNFEVIRKTSVSNLNVIIHGYNNNVIFKNKLKIAFIPLSSKKWFDVRPDYENDLFSIKYNEDLNQKHNEMIKSILCKCEKMNIDIVVFPELSMNPETESEIQKFIIKTNFQNVKLFFMGSCWNNNHNEAIVINNQGTIILREQKINPYTYYDKCTNRYVTEAIDESKQIELIDLNDLGRIAYYICADLNEEILNNVCKIMHTNFIFLSAFSNDTDLMMKTSASHAERNAITTVLCNSCAALTESKRDLFGSFAVIPDVKEKHLIYKKINVDSTCLSESNCELCIKYIEITR